MTNLAAHLLDTTERHGEHIALKLDDSVLTYATLENEGASRVAGLLKGKGLQAGRPRRGHAPECPDFGSCTTACCVRAAWSFR